MNLLLRKRFLLILLIPVLGLMNCATSSVTEESNPNIIFILADDLGYGDISAYNEGSKIQTKYLDQLAADGVMFTDAHTSSAVCYTYPIWNSNWSIQLEIKVEATCLNGYSEALIPKDRKTLPSYLQDNGYKTLGSESGT